ncbi:hypothetical protein QIS99_18870 [Streptomyces sp. B-S-A8]|uniref:Secreted protein n=1 Tax=Streptomyces solicavernae TaxID=3043614 RepID=A0ABT6RUY3_9ACTN|nr:hypothetical protein [Streptomyces sp. B-S-A8]MDI3388251.1 hypothetical protein [Streptomyces sp. B-S-A8]
MGAGMQGVRKAWLVTVPVLALGLGGAWYLLIRETPLPSTTDKALQAKLDEAVRTPEAVPLSGMTGFDWDRVQVFAYGTDSGDISDAVGDPIEWSVSATSYSGPSLWVFTENGEAVRAVQLDANVPKGGPSWPHGVQVSGGPDANIVTLKPAARAGAGSA